MNVKLDGLENRDFRWGDKDCFSLVRDFYALNFGIEIRNYARPQHWKADTFNLIVTGYEREGFDKITDWRLKDLRPGDVMAMMIGESNPNHFGIYVGNNEFLHHLYGNLSRVSPLKGHWIHSTAFLLRHPLAPDLRPKLRDTPIQDLLSARYNQQTDRAA